MKEIINEVEMKKKEDKKWDFLRCLKVFSIHLLINR